LTDSFIFIELNNNVVSYPTSKNIKSVSVCIGVNDSYRDNGVEILMNTIKRTFPNATIYIIQGSWGWGNVKKDNSIKKAKPTISPRSRFIRLQAARDVPPVASRSSTNRTRVPGTIASW